MRTVVAYSTASTSKSGGFVTGLKAEIKVEHPVLGTILSSRVFNIKTGKQIPVDTECDIDMKDFDVNKWTNTDDEGKEQTSFWLIAKGE